MNEFPKKLKIHTEPDSILRAESELFNTEKIKTSEFKIFCSLLLEKMKEAEGIGIAAPQVGVSIRVCIVSDNGKNPIFLINPEITWFSKEKISLPERCLSVPNVFGMVTRPKAVHVKGLNENGEKIKLKAKGWFSRVIQHEIDHLDGILFIDKADSIDKENKFDTKL